MAYVGERRSLRSASWLQIARTNSPNACFSVALARGAHRRGGDPDGACMRWLRIIEKPHANPGHQGVPSLGRGPL